MIITVTGSRHARGPHHERRIEVVIRWLVGDHDLASMELWHGGAPGADAISGAVAEALGIPVRVFEADWKAPCRETCKPGHRTSRAQFGADSFCPTAGNYRNDDMITALAPHRGTAVVLVFPVIGLPCRGTTDCRNRALAAGLPTLIFPLEPA